MRTDGWLFSDLCLVISILVILFVRGGLEDNGREAVCDCVPVDACCANPISISLDLNSKT